MKKLLIIALFSISFLGNAQQTNFFLVNLALQESSILNKIENQEEKELFYKKISSLTTSVNGVLIDDQSDYYLLTDIFASELKTSTAGFLPVGSFKIILKWKLVYGKDGKSFKEMSFIKDYVSNTEREAIQKMINDFNFNETELQDFFDSGFQKMRNFYNQNCEKIVTSAKKYQSIGEPEKALAICLSVPSDQPCFNSLSVLVNQMYTSLSYKSDYGVFLQAQDYVSRGEYKNAFEILNGISIYSQFYNKSQLLSKQINDFIFNQKELQKRIELTDSEQRLKVTEIDLQQKRNELQQSINYANIEIANHKNESDRSIALSEIQNKKDMKVMDLQSKERTQLMKTAGSLLGAYISRPAAPKNTNFYIIK